MRLRLLYLQKRLSINGRNSLSGRRLYDGLRAASEECLLGHVVYSDADADTVRDPRLKGDIVAERLYRQLSPNVVFVEGGLFASDDGTWKFPRPLAVEFVHGGGTLIVVDVGRNETREAKRHYREAMTLFHASINYGPNDAENAVYGADPKSCYNGASQIICTPENMIISDWLKPAYDGVDSILAGLPVHLVPMTDVLASGNQGTTGVLQNDLWVDEHDCCPFATVSSPESGFAVLIAALVSSDTWAEVCPGNTRWLMNTVALLAAESDRSAARRASHLTSSHRLFLSHRSVDKQIVDPVAAELKKCGIGIWYDKDQLVPSQSLVAEISAGLDRMTHFVLFWSRTCVGAPWVERELGAATAKLIDRKLPILIVRLDTTPVPAILADLFRIEAQQSAPAEVARSIAGAVDRLSQRARS